MLARSHGIWIVGADFSIISLPADQLWTEGTGRELALGAAHAVLSLNSNVPEKDIVWCAVEAAITYESTCGGDPWVKELIEAAAPNE